MTTRQTRLEGITADKARTGRVRRTLDQTVTSWRKMGRVDVSDEALIGLARTLADAVDTADEQRRVGDAGPVPVGMCARPYLDDLTRLYERCAPLEVTDPLDLARLLSGPVLDTETS